MYSSNLGILTSVNLNFVDPIEPLLLKNKVRQQVHTLKKIIAIWSQTRVNCLFDMSWYLVIGGFGFLRPCAQLREDLLYTVRWQPTPSCCPILSGRAGAYQEFQNLAMPGCMPQRPTSWFMLVLAFLLMSVCLNIYCFNVSLLEHARNISVQIWQLKIQFIVKFKICRRTLFIWKLLYQGPRVSGAAADYPIH
jgi:hypothetical protein